MESRTILDAFVTYADWYKKNKDKNGIQKADVVRFTQELGNYSAAISRLQRQIGEPRYDATEIAEKQKALQNANDACIPEFSSIMREHSENLNKALDSLLSNKKAHDKDGKVSLKGKKNYLEILNVLLPVLQQELNGYCQQEAGLIGQHWEHYKGCFDPLTVSKQWAVDQYARGIANGLIQDLVDQNIKKFGPEAPNITQLLTKVIVYAADDLRKADFTNDKKATLKVFQAMRASALQKDTTNEVFLNEKCGIVTEKLPKSPTTRGAYSAPGEIETRKVEITHGAKAAGDFSAEQKRELAKLRPESPASTAKTFIQLSGNKDEAIRAAKEHKAAGYSLEEKAPVNSPTAEQKQAAGTPLPESPRGASVEQRTANNNNNSNNNSNSNSNSNNNNNNNNNVTAMGNVQQPAFDYKIVVVDLSPSVKGLVDQFEGQVTKDDGRQTVTIDDVELNLKMVTCSAWEGNNMTPIRNTTHDCDGVVFVYDGSEKNLSRGFLEAYAEVLNNLENKGIPATFVAKCNLGEIPVNEMQQEASKRNMKHVEWSGNNENSVTAVLTDLTKQIRDIEKSHTNQFKL